MISPSRRIAGLDAIVRNQEPDGPPTWCFFAQERFQAAANYGNQPPDVVLEHIEDVERIIRAYDEIRREHHLDLIDTTILISHSAFSSDNQSAEGIAGMIVGAYWRWNSERYGETKAWGMQRSVGEFEGEIAGCLATLNPA